MTKKENQKARIMRYLDIHPEGITPYEAFVHLRITKLSTRVGEIIRDGNYPIKKIMEYKLNEDGSLEHYMRYWKAGVVDA